MITSPGLAEKSERLHTLPLATIATLSSVVLAFLLAAVNPWLALAGLAALLIALAIVTNPEQAALVVFFILYANLSVLLIRRGAPTQVAGSFFLLLGVPLFHRLIVRREPLIITPVIVLMVAYLAVLLLSAAASDRPQLTFSRIQNYILEGLVLYFLVVNVVPDRVMLRRTLWVVVLAGAVMGGVTFYQGTTRSYDNDFGGFAQVTRSAVSVGEENFLGKAPQVQRLAGPIGEKNRFAQVLVVLVPITVALGLSEQRRSGRWAAWAALLLILGGMLYTFSRGAGVALGVMVLVIMPPPMIRPRIAAAIGTAAVVLALTFAPGYIYRLSSLSNITALLGGDASQTDTSVQGRATENLATLRIFLDHPVLGVGPGQTPRFIRDYGRSVGFKLLDPNRRAHNLYLEELADTGVVGFSFFFAMMGVTLAGLYRVRHRTQRDDRVAYLLASGMILSLLTYLVTAIFLHLSYERYYWFLLALAGVTARVLAFPVATESSSDPSTRTPSL
jgi:O-antigen ligase